MNLTEDSVTVPVPGFDFSNIPEAWWFYPAIVSIIGAILLIKAWNTPPWRGIILVSATIVATIFLVRNGVFPNT